MARTTLDHPYAEAGKGHPHQAIHRNRTIALSAKPATTVAAVALTAIFLLSGCAVRGLQEERDLSRTRRESPAPAHEEIAVWHVAELVKLDQAVILLRNQHGIHGAVETRQLQRIHAIGERIVRAAGEGPKPELVVLASRSVNAFAYVNGTQPTIALSLGMIRLLANDEDAWAALLGHELAHLRLDHIRAMKDRREKTEVTSSIAGAILSVIGLPFASIAADATTALAERAYSRDDEREADRVGLQYMRQAGFADAGAINLQQRLLTTRGSAQIPFLSTHPSGEDRIEQLRRLMRNGD